MRVALLAAALLLPGSLAAQTIKLTGKVEHPRTVTMDELRTMPAITVKVAQLAGTRQSDASFTGTLLLPLVKSAGLVDAPGKSGPLQHVFLPRGGDDYAAAIAVGEVDPEFEGKQVILAWERDGKRLDTPQIVVPGDVRAGRAVHDVVEIEVR